MLAVVAAEQGREAGEVVPERFDPVGMAIHELCEGVAELAVVGREPLAQEPQEVG